MRILICDDEVLARERLVRLIEQLGHTVVAQASNGIQAIEMVRQYQPDVVLLDMRMPEMTGLQCAAQLQQLDLPPAVVFCTAFDQYALDAFKANASDYLLKPISLDDLKQSLDKVTRLNQAQNQAQSQIKHQLQNMDSQQTIHKKHITARTHKGIELIPIDDIYYFLADQKYVMVRYRQGKVLIDETLKELEHTFADQFIRIHRNALLAIKYLDGLENIPNGYYQVRCKEIDDRLLVSRRHMASLKECMENL